MKNYSRSAREQNIDKQNLKKLKDLYKMYIYGGYSILNYRHMNGYLEIIMYAENCRQIKIKFTI